MSHFARNGSRIDVNVQHFIVSPVCQCWFMAWSRRFLKIADKFDFKVCSYMHTFVCVQRWLPRLQSLIIWVLVLSQLVWFFWPHLVGYDATHFATGNSSFFCRLFSRHLREVFIIFGESLNLLRMEIRVQKLCSKSILRRCSWQSSQKRQKLPTTMRCKVNKRASSKQLK